MGKLEGIWSIRILGAKRRMGIVWGRWEYVSKTVLFKGQQWVTCGWIGVNSELVFCIFHMALANRNLQKESFQEN
jgi:hypothetical protein